MDPANQFLGCTVNGYEWIYETVQGSMFVLMHMACICLQAIMLEKVFYGVPKELGYFDGYEDDDSIYEERPSFAFDRRGKEGKGALKGSWVLSRSSGVSNEDDDRFVHLK